MRTEMGSMRRVQSAVAESVIRAFESNDTAFACGQHRCLECGFDRFKTGVAEYGLSRLGVWNLRFGNLPGPPFKGDSAQFSRQFRLELMRVNVAHRMRQLGHLALTSLHHTWIGVSGSRDAERSRQVEIFISYDVPNMRAACAFPDDGP